LQLALDERASDNVFVLQDKRVRVVHLSFWRSHIAHTVVVPLKAHKHWALAQTCRGDVQALICCSAFEGFPLVTDERKGKDEARLVSFEGVLFELYLETQAFAVESLEALLNCAIFFWKVGVVDEVLNRPTFCKVL